MFFAEVVLVVTSFRREYLRRTDVISYVVSTGINIHLTPLENVKLHSVARTQIQFPKLFQPGFVGLYPETLPLDSRPDCLSPKYVGI